MLNKIKKKWSYFLITMKLGPAVGYGNWEKVIDLQNKLNEISGDTEDGYATFSKAYYHLNNFEKAIHYGHKALEVDKSDFDVIKILTEIYYKLNEHDKAKEFANKALANSPKTISDRTGSFLVFFFKMLSFIPRFRKAHMRLENSIRDSEIRQNKWLIWANDYTKGGNEPSEGDTDQIIANKKMIANWSNRFPDLNGEWTHWWIEGEEHCLGVVSSEKLSEGVNLIIKNWKRYSSIYAYRAKRGEDGNPIFKSKHRVEISNYKNDLKIYKPY